MVFNVLAHNKDDHARNFSFLHQESGWRPNAESPYAQGLSQFTPSTAKWLPSVCPETGAPDVWNPTWSLGAIACYDAWLYNRVQPLAWGDMRRSFDKPSLTVGTHYKPGQIDQCSRWHFTLRAYNGGEGWMVRERRAAAVGGWNPNRWEEVKDTRLRAAWAHKENTGYPMRIMYLLEPVYRRAGWSGASTC